jgi:hypothetical protein
MAEDEFFAVRLFVRWYRIRQTCPDLVPPLLQVPSQDLGGRIYTFDNEADPWGSKRRIALSDLAALVAAAEASRRKPMGAAKLRAGEDASCTA